ncbi:hypothetical protein G6F24_014439 [Rhizopus arrhizus]|nr:hypothetical protein G6F24_014439 [Rhizopus arrhizus]
MNTLLNGSVFPAHPPRAPMPAAHTPVLSTLAVLIAAALAASPSHAAEADAEPATTAAAANVAASTLDAVVVTGSRTSTRTVKNSSTPIDVISAEDLTATGQGNLLEALQRALPCATCRRATRWCW